MIPKYASNTELAKLLEVHPVTITRWINAGHIPQPMRKRARCYHVVQDVLAACVENRLEISETALQVYRMNQDQQ